MPWVESRSISNGLKGRERFCRIHSALGSGSRGPSGRGIVAGGGPRESAFGLIPGLDSPGPLGRGRNLICTV